MASAQTKTITFEDIVQGRDSTVRVTDDGMVYAVDLVIAMTGKDRDHASQAIRSIPYESFETTKFQERQMSNRYDCHPHS